MLSNLHCVSGDETQNTASFVGFLEKRYNCICELLNGNIMINVGERSGSNPHVLIDAHMDEIGLICSYIDEEGFIVPGNIGGMDYRLLPAQRVVIHGKKDILGIVSSVPPHLSKDGTISSAEDVLIDTGYSSDELRELVPLGSTISFATECKELQYGRMCGKSFDDRAGVAALIKMMDLLRDEKNLSCSYTVLFSASEEIGERGAKTACYHISPDIAIAVDAGFAISPGEDVHKCGKMGEGPMIGVSPSLSSEITQMLIDVAESSGISYQKEIMSGLSGTNADQFSVSRGGVRTCTCSIPLKYMHTPAEVVDISDIESTARLLAQFIREVK